MLSNETQLELAEYLKAVAFAEMEVEVARNLLAERNEFDPLVTFQRIDSKDRGHITMEDFIKFLNDLDVPAYESDINNIFKIYDSTGARQLSFPDFIRLCLPIPQRYMYDETPNQLTSKLRVSSHSPFRAEWGVARIIEREIVVNRRLSLQRKQLIARPDWDVAEAFAAIDRQEENVLEPSTLLDFFKNKWIKADDGTVEFLLRRTDKDNDGMLNFAEFVQIFFPYDRYDRIITKSSPGNQNRATKTTNIKLKQLQLDKLHGQKIQEGYDEGISTKMSTFRESERSRSTALPSKTAISTSRTNLGFDPGRNSQRGSDQKTDRMALSGLLYSPSELQTHRIDREQYDYETRRRSRLSIAGQTPPRSQFSPFQESKRTHPSQNFLVSDSLTERHTNPSVDNSFGFIQNKNPIEKTTEKGQGFQQWNHPNGVTVKEPVNDSSGFYTTKSEFSTTPERTPQKGFGTPDRLILTNSDRNQLISHKKSISMIDYAANQPSDFFTTPSKSTNKDSDWCYTSGSQKQSQSNGLTPSTKFKELQTDSRPTSKQSYSKNYFIDALNEFIQLMRELEEFKINLALRKDFTPYIAYQSMIDVLGDNRIVKRRFSDLMRAYGTNLKYSQITILFDFLDRDRDGVIGLNDFEFNIYPQQKEHIEMIEQRHNAFVLTAGTQDLVLEFLVKCYETATKWREIKQKIYKNSEFSVEVAFRMLDCRLKGYIELPDLVEAFELCGFESSKNELFFLINRLDRDNDEKISFDDFIQEFNPDNEAISG